MSDRARSDGAGMAVPAIPRTRATGWGHEAAPTPQVQSNQQMFFKKRTQKCASDAESVVLFPNQ